MSKKKKRLNFSAANVAKYITIIAGIITIIGYSFKDAFLEKKAATVVKSDTVTNIENQLNIGTVNGTVVNSSGENASTTINIDKSGKRDSITFNQNNE